jgi:hypothetical protein
VSAHKGRASGAFEVKLAPLAPYNTAEGAALGRASLDKVFDGDLVATSAGEMLTAGNPKSGSAGYVAVERVTGTLHGRTGTFALMHTGRMTRGTPSLEITVVPDSGTDELTGLSGSLEIMVVEKKHLYIFDYAIEPVA